MITVYRLALLSIAGVTLVGCLGNEELVSRWKSICTRQGYVEGTPEFKKCFDENRPREIGGGGGGGGGGP